MCEGSHRGLESCRENLVQFFVEKEMVSVDEASERLSGVVRVFGCGCRAIVVRDVLALIFSTSNDGRVEEGSGL